MFLQFDTNALREWINFKPNTNVQEGVLSLLVGILIIIHSNLSKINEGFSFRVDGISSFSKLYYCCNWIRLCRIALSACILEEEKCFKTKLALDRKIIGFDINAIRINQLNEGLDNTNELKKEQLENLSLISFTCQLEKIVLADVFIITVPTPIKDGNIPDLSPLKDASTSVGKALRIRENLYKKDIRKKYNPIIIYESTVYPGCTEEICLPILEKESNLKANKDFLWI